MSDDQTFQSRTSAADGHLMISGTGRAGTTLLVQYFTALGFDTGFTLDQTRSRVDDIAHAGLETSIKNSDRVPYVAKSPAYTGSLGGLLDAGEVTVKACIIPMRDLYSAAESRRAVMRRAEDAGRDGTRQAGGLVYGAQRNPASQEGRLAMRFYQLVHALVLHDVPTYFLRFPDFARGEQDLFTALEPLLAAHGVTAAESRAALDSVRRPELINDFADGS